MTQHLRELNIVFGVICLGLLCWRTPTILLKLTSKRLYFALAAFPILVCFGSVNAVATHRPPTHLTICFSLAYVALDVFLIWLPKGLR